ncbi:MAG: hypothetical protein KC619_33965 [Myxococcales bacterium]|nr:hypothetical protein [Myxococcales bacterium]
MFSRRSLLITSILALALAGCDGSPPGTDAGVDAAVEEDAGPPLTCATVTQLTGVLDDTVSVTFDTAMTETRPRDLGLGCGNDEAELRWAPQEVVELTVPGDPGSNYAVEFTSNVPGTDADFNTVIQARDACESVPTDGFPPRCFDDVAADEFRTTGGLTVPGGTVLYFIVTGYSEPPAEQMTVDRGTIEVDFTIRRGDPPTISDGYLRLVGDDVRIQLTGTDPNADVRGVAMNFYGADGALLDIYGDGTATENGDIFVVRFDAPPATGTDWTGGSWVYATDINLGPYLRGAGVAEVQFRVFDAAWGISAPLRRPIQEGTLVGLGETCDDDHYCRLEMVCSSGVCIPDAAVASMCDGAPDISVPATSTMGATVTRMGTTGAGLGLMDVPLDCVRGDANAGIGAEAVYKVDVPLDAFDLLLTTDLPGTGMTDTIIYVRSQCPDSGTVIDCNDDIASGNAHSQLELRDLTMGTYYVIVERYGGLASGTIPHELGVTVRPVVASGQVCDEATTRCATGTCTAGMCP